MHKILYILNMKILNTEEITKRLIPITEFRRNAGEILREIETIGTVIITKGGKPIVELRPLKETNKKDKLKKTFGAWKDLDIESEILYKKILKWRKKGSRKFFPFLNKIFKEHAK